MFTNPKTNLEQFGLDKGHIVADLGAGSGFYTIEAARMVAPTGRVYAVDIQKDLLERLRKEAKTNRVHNVEILVGDLEKLGGTKLRDAGIDRLIISNILFMIENKKVLISEIKRVLKNDGRVLAIDWSSSFGHLGPHPDQVVYKDSMVKLFKEGGFELEKEIEAGDHHYGIIFRK
jgi:FkbM family methyltransferase